ncbi:N-acetylmuramoyl-L-alanine amidase [Serinicoccus sediminis]|uniref:peptidoglycan recognition protein family protein n=1 Tax=Serinicoccus sediminis TaxID=2306021 RepID=UPI001021B0BE|nr:N-acetylmuramoyl-L-alanine amidase [Serinicoccus sediminis]
MMLTDLADAVRRAGVLTVEEVAGWRTRSAAPAGGPYGGPGLDSVECLIAHHTGSSPAATGDYPTRRTILEGNGSTPGPLSQLGLGRSGRTVLVFAAGICWHAGPVHEDWQRNRSALGIEAEHSGSLWEPWLPSRYGGYVLLTAAAAEHYDVPTSRVRSHAEVSTAGKIDPVFDMATFRRHVDEARAGGQGPWVADMPLPSTRLQLGSRGVDVAAHQRSLVMAGHELVVDGDWGPATDTEHRSWQESRALEVDGIAGPKSALEIREQLTELDLQRSLPDPTPIPAPDPVDPTPAPAPAPEESRPVTVAPKYPRAYPSMSRVRTDGFWRDLEAVLREEGVPITCGPSHHRSGACRPGKHGHGSTSRHWDGRAIDVSMDPPSGAPVSDHERGHLDAKTLCLSTLLPGLPMVWNRGTGDHVDHAHLQDVPLTPLSVRHVRRTGVPVRGVLVFGQQGDAVTAWQRQLRAKGLPVHVDGDFGPQVFLATKLAQKTWGITPDGIVGPASLRTAASAPSIDLDGGTLTGPAPKVQDPDPAPRPTPAKPAPSTPALPVLEQGSRGPAVKALQAGALRVFPAYAGAIKRSGGADGVFGPGTKAWVLEFQRRSGLTRDGVVGPRTWAALGKHGIRP